MTGEKRETGSAYNLRSFTPEERRGLYAGLRYALSIFLAVSITLVIVALVSGAVGG